VIQSVIVLGAGSAGLIAALSLKCKIPALQVCVVGSSEIGVIGVGEGTNPNFPTLLFDYLGISRKRFYQQAEPTWKIGARFLWGPRSHFDYTFSLQLDAQWSDLAKPNGYYCDDDFQCCDVASACMAHGKVFPRQPRGAGPDIQDWHAFHIENRKLVETLHSIALESGVTFIDAKVSGAERGPTGIAALHLEDGRRLEADLFVDASGFRSELLGRTLEEPYIPFDHSLFCDRAAVGGWARTDEPILPYTTAETMDSGWAWQIEHEHFINRGYVFSSHAISDDEAVAEFLRKNPKIKEPPRVVKFRSGCYRNMWVDNVVAIGNSSGFVEPLEATALMIVCAESQALVSFLQNGAMQVTPTMRKLFNRRITGMWEDVRNFLALHYRYNTRLDTPYWQRCRNETDLSGLAELLEFYEENGPTGFGRYFLRTQENSWGIEGYLVMLVGNRVPYRSQYNATAQEREAWNRHRARFTATAAGGMDVKEALACIRHPNWRWNEERRGLARSGPFDAAPVYRQ